MADTPMITDESWVDDLMGGPDPAAVPTAATMQPGVADLDAAQPEPEPGPEPKCRSR